MGSTFVQNECADFKEGTIRDDVRASDQAISAKHERLRMAVPLRTDTEITDQVREAWLWVKDSPLVIDDENIARLYDAIVRPAFKDGPRTIRLTNEQSDEVQTNFMGTVRGSLSGLFGMFAAEAEGSAERQKAKSSKKESEQELVLEPISTSHRQLEQLIVYYSLLHPERLLVGDNTALLDWHDRKLAQILPRALCLIDLPPGLRFIPMAAEFENGKVQRLFGDLAHKAGRQLPAYDRDRKANYWLSLTELAEPARAAEVIEEASAEHGRVEWIDFRVVVDGTGRSVHLHLESRGRYFTGAFAYMVVRRVVGHGLRLVGTLKDGPDLNVLAMYEK